MVYCVVLSGGDGKRMRANIPKQYLKLKDKPIIIWTINALINSKLFDKIFITINVNWENYVIELLQKHICSESLKKIEIYTSQSKNRTICLCETINSIIKNNIVNSDDIIITHDAVRPFISFKILEDCIAKAKEFSVAMATVISTETIYFSNLDGNIIKSANRNTSYLGQSPHGCNLKLLSHVLNSYSDNELEKADSVSQLFINRNIYVKASYGEDINFKITTPKDLKFAEFYVEHFL